MSAKSVDKVTGLGSLGSKIIFSFPVRPCMLEVSSSIVVLRFTCLALPESQSLCHT